MIIGKSKKAIAALVFTGVMLTSGCSASDKMINLINNGEYSKAVSEFDNQEYSESDNEALAKFFNEKFDKNFLAYVNGEIDYDEARELSETAAYMNISGTFEAMHEYNCNTYSFKKAEESMSESSYLQAYKDYKDITSSSEEIKTVIQKKTDNAITLFNEQISSDIDAMTEKGRYDDAITVVKSILNDINESEITELYNNKLESLTQSYTAYQLEQLSKKVDEYTSKGLYQDALNYLNDQRYYTDSPEMISAVDSKTAEVNEEYTIAQATDLANDGNYDEAITIINTYNADNESEKVDELYENISSEYIAFILGKVQPLADKKDYLTAVNILNNAKIILDAQEFSDKLAELDAVRPTYLCEIKCTNSDRYYEIVGEEKADTIGNKYQSGNLFLVTYAWDPGYADYYLGYKYNQLNGTIAIEDEESKNTTGTFEILGDDAVIYSLDVSRQTVPTPISVDISNVNWLKFRVTGNRWDRLAVLISDFTLTKE